MQKKEQQLDIGLERLYTKMAILAANAPRMHSENQNWFTASYNIHDTNNL